MISLVDALFTPAPFQPGDSPISPIVRPSCPFPGFSPESPAGILFGFDRTASASASSVSTDLSFTTSKQYCSCQMRSSGAASAGGGPVAMTRAPVSAFETRLGPIPIPPAPATSLQTPQADGNSDIGSGSAEPSPVLVVVDANKEISTNALDWALSYVVQKGDSVKLLGVLEHILNPMGYKSRADEKSWNGANRKVLDAEIASHLVMFERIPNIYGRVEKIGAKLEIEVRARVNSKFLVVEEARRLNARYVVIDRNIKKDKKFYIENLKCFVTRVKSTTNFEHLRHGVPAAEQEVIDAGHDSPPVALPTPVLVAAMPTPPVQASLTPTVSQPLVPLPQQQQQQEEWPPSPSSPSSEFVTGPVRPGDFPHSYEGLSSASAFHRHSRRPVSMAAAYATLAEGAMREQALRRWLSDPYGMNDPAYGSRMAELAGNMAIGYPGDAFMHHTPLPSPPSAITEEALAEYMSNISPYHEARNTLPPLSAPKPNVDRTSTRCVIPSFKSTQSRQPKSTRRSQHGVSPGSSGYTAESAAAELRSLTSDNARGEPSPISVQPRRAADAKWALDLLGVGNPEVQAIAMPSMPLVPPVVRKSEQPEQPQRHAVPPDRASSVRRAVSSTKQSSGAPPLCSLCGQQSPDFGKVKRFTFAELQRATNNFSGELYLAEGGYGNVYRGELPEGQLVAVKQHKLASSQTDEQFVAEVEALACAQHRNLVTLIGYCVENSLRLLVYEYICNGSLERHLSAKSKTSLEWINRLKIALGSARALRYLHEECRVGCIVHRDMRPNNILLTHDFTPMVGDFGLARRQPSGDREEETRVLGTIGYVAPEYAETGKITDKADVYAFGVVLLELITGRKAIDHSRPRDQILLTDWARPLLDSYDKQLVDPRLKANYDEYEMHCMMHAANQCIKKDPLMRPRMVQVLRILNPLEESEWIYSRGRNGAVTVPGSDGNQSEEMLSSQVSSRGSQSQGGSCSASEASYSDASDTDSLPRHHQHRHQSLASNKFSRAMSGGKSLWKSFARDKLQRDDSSRDIAAVNRMSVDDLSYNGML